MATTLDSIWDFPAENSTTQRSPPRDPSKRSTLFLNSDTEDEAPTTPAPQAGSSSMNNKALIDAMFDDLDDEEETLQFAPALDVEALRREADARNAKLLSQRPIMSSSPIRELGDPLNEGETKGKKGKKKRPPPPKLDETLLLSSEGFPALIKEAKKFKPKGKGHEASDLNRVLTMYQFWTQRMYPKMQFADTIQRVEKLCHSKRMHVALSVWKDEANGTLHGKRLDDPIDLTDSEKDDSDDVQTRKKIPATEQNDASLSRPITSAPLKSVRPSTNVEPDFDIDAMIEEDQQELQQPGPSPPSSPPREPITSTNKTTANDDDEDMFDTMDDAFDYSALDGTTAVSSGTGQGNSAAVDEDEDMWDIVREMEIQEAARQAEPGPSQPTATQGSGQAQQDTPPQKATNDEGWDDMYL